VWPNRPMRELLQYRNPRGIRLRHSSGTLPRLTSPPFPSLRSTTYVARLRGKHWIATVRKGHVTSLSSRASIHKAAFSACQTPAFIRETEESCQFSRSSRQLRSRQLTTRSLQLRTSRQLNVLCVINCEVNNYSSAKEMPNKLIVK
jgi:hypothetical protein